MEFEFSYLTANCTVNIDEENIYTKVGVIKRTIKKSNLQYVYIKPYETYSKLILRYDDGNGKIKNYKIIHTYGDQTVTELVDYLVENTNCRDLRNVDEKEAMALLKAKDETKTAFIAVFVVLAVVVSIFFLPSFMHFFDSGSQITDITNVINDKDLTTHNVIVKNGVMLDGMYAETSSTRRGSTTTTTKYYFPIVESDWTKEKPIKVIVETGEISQAEIDELFSASEVKGVLKTVMWEGGLDDDDVEFLNKEYGYIISDDVTVLDTDPPSYKVSMIIYLVILVILIVIMFFARKKIVK